MPKLYEYFGLIVFFYSNEHEPIHVHGKYQNTEGKAGLLIDNGKIVDIEAVHYVEAYKLPSSLAMVYNGWLTLGLF